MPNAEDRLRPAPAPRSAGPELSVDLSATLRALREEAHPAKNGHRQISLLHRGSVRMVLFAFDAGGYLKQHHAPGVVTIQVLRGEFRFHTPGGSHELSVGQLLVLEPGVLHDVLAVQAGDLLLTIQPEAPGDDSVPRSR